MIAVGCMQWLKKWELRSFAGAQWLKGYDKWNVEFEYENLNPINLSRIFF